MISLLPWHPSIFRSTQDIFTNIPCAMSSPEADRELKHPERAELIAELARRVDVGRFNTSAWLFLWFSDLTILHEIVNSASSSPLFCAAASCTLGWDSKAMDQFLQACKFFLWLTGKNGGAYTLTISRSTGLAGLAYQKTISLSERLPKPTVSRIFK